MRGLMFIMAAVACLVMPGCASIMSDNTTLTQIDSIPSDAECVVEGEDFKTVVTPPTSMMLPASAAPLTITCNMDGYHMLTEVVDTSVDGWIFGNILFGGVIGAIIDAANDNGEKYPERVALTLFRNEFASEDELAAYYNQQEQQINEKFDSMVAAADGSESKIKELVKSRTDKLAQVQKFRSASFVTAHPEKK